MGRITAINRQKRRADRVSVYIDGKFAVGCSAEAVSVMGLCVGQELTEADVADLRSPGGDRRAFERALCLVSYRPRSTGEIRSRLLREGFEEQVVSGAIGRLAKLKMVDDESFSKEWVRSRMAGKPMGKPRLKYELRRKGVAADVIDKALEQVDDVKEHELAMSLAETKMRKFSEGIEARKKLAEFLARRGFRWGIVNRVIGDLCSKD
jgi:regulatory protein